MNFLLGTPLSDPLFLLVAVPAVLFVGLAKGGLTAVGGLSVPLMAMVIAPADAAAITLPLLCFSDLFAMWTYRRVWDRGLLGPLLAGAAAGVALGAASFGLLGDDVVRILIGLIAVVFALRHWTRGLFPAGSARPASMRVGVFWAAVSGFTSFLAHAGGPPLMVFLMPRRMERMLFTGTCVMFFGVVNLLKLVPYAWLGLLNVGNLTVSAALAPLAAVGVAIGAWMIRVMDDKIFYQITYIGIFLSGAKLIWDGLAPTLHF